MNDDERLAQAAKQAMQQAYAPYSDFMVGAALLCADDSVVTGCNVENAAYSPSICAERTAVCKAVSEGKRAFRTLAVCGGKHGVIAGACPPCGVCRQVLREFCKPESLRILLVTQDGYRVTTLDALLPESFGGEQLV